MADLRFAAWFLWMKPLVAALSIFLAAVCSAALALSLSPATTASRVARMAVLSSLLTALLRSCAFLLVPMRLICDLMFATSIPSVSDLVEVCDVVVCIRRRDRQSNAGTKQLCRARK